MVRRRSRAVSNHEATMRFSSFETRPTGPREARPDDKLRRRSSSDERNCARAGMRQTTRTKRSSAMRILVVGAGAIGGYFGGRMLEAGRDVTFLVRPKRAAELASAGLVIKSPNGDVTLKNPPTVQADRLAEKFDVVLLSCKAFDLDDAIQSFAPAVGPQTTIIPLLNGMRHLGVLDDKFGRERVLGGLCAIAVTLNDQREVVQLNPMQSLNFGERDGRLSDRVRAIAEVMASGDVGEVGVPRHARRLHLPDADLSGQYPGCTGRQGFYPRHARRMQRRRGSR